MAEKMKSAEAAAPLIDNGDVKKLLSLLSKVEGDRAKEFSQLIAYVDAMGRQFDRVSAELVQVRGQLAELQQSPVKKALSAAVTGLEKGVHAARERLAAVKEQIAEGAARAVEEVKHAGLAGLNKAVSFLGVKKTLNLLRGDLHNTVTDAKATIAKVEAVGEELRSVGGHLKQAGRATVGKERQEVDASKEGRFQAGLLAPLRSFRDIVEHMEQSAGKAVGQLEKLEQAGCRIFRTDKQGTIIADSDGSKITWTTISGQIGTEQTGAGQTGTGQTYILNTNTKKFHVPECSSVSQIRDGNRREVTSTRDELTEAGYAPCKQCNP